jgi:NTP pyrophosphatase (non-canonical NTP hydrolase)
MDMDEYQADASVYANYAHLVYPFLALQEESGEVAGKVAKRLRKFGDLWLEPLDDWDAFRRDVAKELGDTLWQLQECCSLIGYSLGDIANMNLLKLQDRADRGVIVGEGDNR